MSKHECRHASQQQHSARVSAQASMASGSFPPFRDHGTTGPSTQALRPPYHDSKTRAALAPQAQNSPEHSQYYKQAKAPMKSPEGTAPCHVAHASTSSGARRTCSMHDSPRYQAHTQHTTIFRQAHSWTIHGPTGISRWRGRLSPTAVSLFGWRRQSLGRRQRCRGAARHWRAPSASRTAAKT